MEPPGKPGRFTPNMSPALRALISAAGSRCASSGFGHGERDLIVRIVEARPELSSRALSEALAAEGVRVSDRTLRGFLKRHRMELSRRRAVRRQRKRWKASGG